MVKSNVNDIISGVCEIDYIFEDTFPIRFSVKNDNEEKLFEAGLCLMSDGYGDWCETQYLVEIQKKSRKKLMRVIDIQNPDYMKNKDIKNMINTCCEIKENSIISIDVDKSFNGSYNEDVLNFMDTDNMYEACEKYTWCEK